MAKDRKTAENAGKPNPADPWISTVRNLYFESLWRSKFYGVKLSRMQSAETCTEIFVALFTAGSGIAGWWLWEIPTGKNLWAVLVGAASALAIAKPFFALHKRIENLSKLFSGYTEEVEILKGLGDDLRDEIWPSANEHALNQVYDRNEEFAKLQLPNPSGRLTDWAKAEALEELNSDIRWSSGSSTAAPTP